MGKAIFELKNDTIRAVFQKDDCQYFQAGLKRGVTGVRSPSKETHIAMFQR